MATIKTYMNGVEMKEIYQNTVRLDEMYMNGVIVFKRQLELTMPQFSQTFSLRSYIDANNPNGSDVIIITNDFIQPSMVTGDLTGLNVTLINNGEFRGTYAGDDAMELTSPIKLLNNYWIRGAGGSGGKGGNGGTGAKGATASSKVINLTIAESRTNTDGCAEVPHSGVLIWYSHYQTLFYWDGSRVYEGPQRGGCTPLVGGWKYCGSGNQSVCGGGGSNYETYSITRSKVITHAIPGGDGGNGGSGGTGCNGSTGISFKTNAGSRVTSCTGLSGNTGVSGTRYTWVDPSGATHYGNTGGTGYTGGAGGYGGAGGNWGTNGEKGGTGARGSGYGSYGSYGTSGTASGKSIRGTSFLSSGSVIGYLSGPTI